MTSKHGIANFTGRLTLGVVLAAGLLLSGCASQQETGEDMTISPINSGHGTLALDADDMIRIMTRAGFNHEQILNLGPTLRNAIAQYGGARVREKRKLTRAMFLVQGNEIYGMAMEGGPFMYQPRGAGEAGDDVAAAAEQASDGR